MKESGIDSQKIIRRKRDGELEYQPDDLTIEEPLEIRIGRKALATTMRTPGHDEELAAGFLVSEAIVRKRQEIEGIAASRRNVDHCQSRGWREIETKFSATLRNDFKQLRNLWQREHRGDPPKFSSNSIVKHQDRY